MGVVAWFDSQGIYFAPEKEEGVYFVVAIQALLCLCVESGWRIRDAGCWMVRWPDWESHRCSSDALYHPACSFVGGSMHLSHFHLCSRAGQGLSIIYYVSHYMVYVSNCTLFERVYVIHYGASVLCSIPFISAAILWLVKCRFSSPHGLMSLKMGFLWASCL